ncbi:hypothetical protein ACUOFC_30900, partial [Escherichia sp. TWPC-MK]
RHLRAACHLNALFQAVTETTTRFVIGFLIESVEMASRGSSSTRISATCRRGTTMCRWSCRPESGISSRYM